MDDSCLMPDLPGAVAAERSRLVIPSRPDWIAPTVEYLRNRAVLCGACQATRASKLLLVLHEALTNSIVHGSLEISSQLKERDDNAFASLLAVRSSDPHYGGRVVLIDTDYDGERCEWSFTDQGNGFDFARYLSDQLPEEPETWLSSGRGILLMRSFLDELRFELGGRRVVLTLYHASGAERRQRQRQHVQRRIQVAPVRGNGSVDWSAAYEAVAQNLSPDGIGLLQSRPSDADHVLLRFETGGEAVCLPAQVRHVRQLGEGVVEVGCVFIVSTGAGEVPAPADPGVASAVEELLTRARGRATSADDRRSHTREPFSERVEVEFSPDGPPIVGYARDLSRGGIAFITRSHVPLKPCVLSLTRPDGQRLRLRGEILRCVPILEGFCDVGARFLSLADTV